MTANTLNFTAAVVTGSAGFIGFHLCKKLLQEGCNVLGIDNFNEYYDVKLKKNRTSILDKYSSFVLAELDIIDETSLLNAVESFIHELNIKLKN